MFVAFLFAFWVFAQRWILACATAHEVEANGMKRWLRLAVQTAFGLRAPVAVAANRLAARGRSATHSVHSWLGGVADASCSWSRA